VTLIVHFCYKFFAINMDTPNFICTKEEQRDSDPFLWAEGVTRCQNAQNDFSAVWEQCHVTADCLLME